MPLDGHSYLVAQGWGGKGTGLREGAISRPLAIAQKKNLAGLGKDRDEAFPFWDHLFSAAAKSIQVKCISDDDDTDASSSDGVTLTRTSTGIFSTRRPVEGTPASSGLNTPSLDESSPQPSKLSLMANAKRDAARKGLYSRFFRGPVIGPETIAAEEKRLATLVSEAFAKQNPAVETVSIREHIEVQTADECIAVDLKVSKSSTSRKKRKTTETPKDEENEDEDEEKRERKRRRKEEKRRQKEEEKAVRIEKTEKDKERSKSKLDKSMTSTSELSVIELGSSKSLKGEEMKESGSERRRRKEEKKSRKLAQQAELPVAEEQRLSAEKKKCLSKPSKLKEKSASRKKSKTTAGDTILFPQPTEAGKKKKRKRTDNDSN